MKSKSPTPADASGRARQPSSTRPPSPAAPAPPAWEVDVPLFSRRMLGQWTLAMLLSGMVFIVIMGAIMLGTGEIDTLPSLAGLGGLVTGGLWLLGLLIMAVLFRGRMRVRYTVDRQGVTYEMIDTRARKANRAAIVVGLLARDARTLGAGLLARSQERMSVRWSGAFRARHDPPRHHITLCNAWRPLLWIQCTPDNYPAVAAAVDHYIEKRGTARRVPSRSALPAYLWRSLAVVLCCLPLFALDKEFDTGLLLPILILCFGLATVWMVNVLGWGVLAGLLLLAGVLAVELGAVRQSTLFKGESYRLVELIDGSEAGLLALAFAGALGLGWLAWGAVRGRWWSALLAGYEDMG